MALRRDQKTLLLAAAATVAVWVVPLLRWIGLPLIYLNTHIHELCHAVTAIATGGSVRSIQVFANGSGVTPVAGGSLFLTASAGYVGAALVGGLLIAGSRTAASASKMLFVSFMFLCASMLLFVRGDLIGFVSGVFWVGCLGVLAKTLKGDTAVFAGQFLGLQLALTSLQSLLVLLRVTTSIERQSDALILERLSGVPAVVWAVGWALTGLAAVGTGLGVAWRPARAKSG